MTQKDTSKRAISFIATERRRSGTLSIGRRQDEDFILLIALTRLSQELIKVRAFQVAPPELEGVLLEDSNIIDCAVIGLQLRPDCESPRAYVVRRPGSDITGEDVKNIISTN